LRIIFCLFLFCFVKISFSYSQGQDVYSAFSVKELKLEFGNLPWERMLDSLKKTGKQKRLIGNLVFNGVRYDSVGVRFKGNSSFHNVREKKSRKLPLNIKLDYLESRKQQVLPGGFKGLKLANGFRDPSFVREILAYDIASHYMDVPKANFVKVYVNGEYFGLYTNTEPIDIDFFIRRNIPQSNVFKCDPSDIILPVNKLCRSDLYSSLAFNGDDKNCYLGDYEPDIKNEESWKRLIAFSKALKNPNEDLNKWIDIDALLWMHAFNHVFVNLDSYTGIFSHNYYLGLDSTGRFKPILWDLNLCFGGFKLDVKGPPLTDEQVKNFSLLGHLEDVNRPLISAVLKKEEYRKIYFAHIATIHKDWLSQQQWKSRAQTYHSIADYWVQQEKSPLYGYDAFKSNLSSSYSLDSKNTIPGLVDFMDGRAQYIGKLPFMQKAKPNYIKHITNITSDSLSIETVWDNSQAVNCYYRVGNSKKFISVSMFAKLDESNGSFHYFAKIPVSGKVEYYFMAQNESSVMFSPERASKEFFVYPLGK
jgi:hypothetical protein